MTGGAAAGSPLARLLSWMGRVTYHRAPRVLALTVLLAVLATYGISQIRVNDNPVKWFEPSHPIRRASDVLNEHLGGTCMAFLTLGVGGEEEPVGRHVDGLFSRLESRSGELEESPPTAPAVFESLRQEALRASSTAASTTALMDELESWATERALGGSAESAAAWEEALLFLDRERQRSQVFKEPRVLRYVSDLQAHLDSMDVVGKTSSVADIVKTVHRELLLGEQEQFRIPDTPEAVAQTLLTYQSSHRAHDLWHFVTPGYDRVSIWTQLKSGDNQDMARVVDAVAAYLGSHPPPRPLEHEWFGLTYLNVVWQQKMVYGMLRAFLGGFAVVFLMMSVLFRSPLWGLFSMVPLTVSIALIYGAIGLVGKDYDMPVAVLSALSLGLAIDYAIHFLARSRQLVGVHGSWPAAIQAVFREPSRAIARNVVVIGMGFLPLVFAPLVTYQTVGILIAAILVTAGAASLFILPALITVFEKRLFAGRKGVPS